MNSIELARVVCEMRHAQHDYFRTRSWSAMQKSMALEKKVDRCVAMVLDGQKELFVKDSPQA